MAEDEARVWLGDLIEAWDAGMRVPPPVAVRTAFAWLAALPDEAAAYEQARKTYEGGPTVPGEVDRNPYLMRQFPDFEALWSDQEFGSWARTLYLPLFETARSARAERKVEGGRA